MKNEILRDKILTWDGNDTKKLVGWLNDFFAELTVEENDEESNRNDGVLLNIPTIPETLSVINQISSSLWAAGRDGLSVVDGSKRVGRVGRVEKFETAKTQDILEFILFKNFFLGKY